MRRLLGSVGLVTGIVLLVYIGAGPWTPPAVLVGRPAPAEQPVEPRRSSSQPSEIQQARIEAAFWTVGLVSAAFIAGFVAIIIGTSVYLRRRRAAEQS